MVWETIQPILVGAVTGALASLVGYAKNLASAEKWDWLKASPMFIIGAIVGGYAAFNGIDNLSAQGVLEASGAIFAINYLFAAIVKFFNNKKNTGKFIVATKKSK